MRSVVVVLPASICAMIPMLRYRSRGVVRAITEYSSGARCHRVGAPSRFCRLQGTPVWPTGARPRQGRALPAIMRERLVGVRHPMRVFPPLDGDAPIVRGIEQFA